MIEEMAAYIKLEIIVQYVFKSILSSLSNIDVFSTHNFGVKYCANISNIVRN
jgi:hypothetical protein